MNRKNFKIKKSSYCFIKQSQNKMHNHSCQLNCTLTKTNDVNKQRLNIFKSINQIWQKVEQMRVQISESSVLNFLQKFMQKKGFYFKELIIQVLRTHSVNKDYYISSNHPRQTLIYQIAKAKEELEEFLWHRFCRDIDIMQQKIIRADQQIRDSVDQQTYQKLTFSFRPLLISNATDLVNQYQNIASNNIQKDMSKLQQMRYGRLTISSRKVSDMHNFICDEKSGVKVLRNTKVNGQMQAEKDLKSVKQNYVINK